MMSLAKLMPLMESMNSGMSSENTQTVSELIEKEITNIKKNSVTDEEIDRAKIQLKGNYILSGEGISAKMQAMGRAALLDRPLRSRDEIISKIDLVNRESVEEIMKTVLDEETLSVISVGPIESSEELFDGLRRK